MNEYPQTLIKILDKLKNEAVTVLSSTTVTADGDTRASPLGIS